MDLRKILKYCPEGWKFYSTIFGDDTCVSNIDEYEGNPCPITIYHSKLGKSASYKIARNGHPFAEGCGECCLFPSREMRDWSKFIAPWYKKERFDPNTLQPFDRVLVRDNKDLTWKINIYSHKYYNPNHPYQCITSVYRYCIPYNDDTKHLVGTKEEAPDFYKYWED